MDLLQQALKRKREEVELKKQVKRAKYLPKKELEKELEAIKKVAGPEPNPATANRENSNSPPPNDASTPPLPPAIIPNFETPSSQTDQTPRLPVADVIRRLRALGEPITLFGETPLMREQRLVQLEASRTEAEMKFGQRNDFYDDLHAEEEEEEAKEAERKKKKKKEEEKNGSADGNGSAEKPKKSLNEREITCREDEIYVFLKQLMHEWEEELEQRPEEEKKSTQGKVAFATFKQTKRYIRPLFKLLRSRTLSKDILALVHEMVTYMKIREYVKSHDAYLRLAIGNAPWPMGVTMVGIHERSAREKIFSNQVAHVLNDETQRKYIQSIKRLLTFCQKKYPTDPSKMVI